MTALLRARADVSTEAPARYAKQLVSHLARRVEWATEGSVSTAGIAGGTGVVEVGDGVNSSSPGPRSPRSPEQGRRSPVLLAGPTVGA